MRSGANRVLRSSAIRLTLHKRIFFIQISEIEKKELPKVGPIGRGVDDRSLSYGRKAGKGL